MTNELEEKVLSLVSDNGANISNIIVALDDTYEASELPPPKGGGFEGSLSSPD
jgi:hypothetical protein